MIVTYQGQKMTVAEAIRQSGSKIPHHTVMYRLHKKWPLQLALHRPLATAETRNGSMRQIREWGKV